MVCPTQSSSPKVGRSPMSASINSFTSTPPYGLYESVKDDKVDESKAVGLPVPSLVPYTRLALLQGEVQICQDFITGSSTACGLPKHTVVMTNRRMIVSCKQVLLCCIHHEWETSLFYKDVVDVSIGHMRSRWLLLFAVIAIAFGSLLFVLCIVAGYFTAGCGMLALFVAPGAASIGKYIVEEHITTGDDLIIDICKPNTAVASWPGLNHKHASKTVVIRLPTTQAYIAMYTLLEHPEVNLMPPVTAPESKTIPVVHA